MRFGQSLKEAQLPEWSAHYCDYDLLKRRIERCGVAVYTLREAPDDERRAAALQAEEEAFTEALEQELQKIQAFLSVQIGELRSRFAVLGQQCEQLPSPPASCMPSPCAMSSLASSQRVRSEDSDPSEGGRSLDLQASCVASPATSQRVRSEPSDGEPSRLSAGLTTEPDLPSRSTRRFGGFVPQTPYPLDHSNGSRSSPLRPDHPVLENVVVDRNLRRGFGTAVDPGPESPMCFRAMGSERLLSDRVEEDRPSHADGSGLHLRTTPPDDDGASFVSKEARASMRLAFVEAYRTARKLESYMIINSMAFSKATKKFRKRRDGPGREPNAGGGTPPLLARRISGLAALASRRQSINGPSHTPSPLASVQVSRATSSRSVTTADEPCESAPASSPPSAAPGLPAPNTKPTIKQRVAAVEAVAADGFGYGTTLVPSLLEQLEAQFGFTFYGSSCTRTEARAHLLVRQHDHALGHDWRTFMLGWRVGASMLLLIWLGWDLTIDYRLRKDGYCEQQVKGYSLWQDPAVKVYHFASALLLLEWCWCALLVIFRRSRINYCFLLELPQEGPSATADSFETAALHTMLFSLNMLLFFKVHHSDMFSADSLHVVNRVLPLIVVLVCAFCTIHPWRTKRQLWVLMGEVLTGFCRPVRFVHVFFADWLTSVVKVWATIAHAMCHYLSSDLFEVCPQASKCESNPVFLNAVLPFISTLPYMLRLLQCLRMYLDTHKRFPHLANGFKYCFALVIVVIGATHSQWKKIDPNASDVINYIWISTYMISTAYTYSWDVFMDWGLSFKDGKPYVFAWARLKRDRRMVCKDSWLPYYAAVAADVFLRFLWTLTLAPSSMPFGSFVQYSVTPLLSYAEIFRRAMWSVFRVENEHLNNTLGYKRVDIVPLHFDRPAGATRDPSHKSNWKAVVTEVGLFITAVVLVYIVGFVTHS